MSTDVINNEILIGTFTIKANGTKVAIEPRDFISVEVEQNLYVPSMAVIKLRHLDLASAYATTFDLATPISVEMGQGSSDSAEVFKGEVVAQEIDVAPTGQPVITIRAYDKRHRLMRGRTIKVFTDVSESDLVSQVCNDAGGLTGSATGAPTEVYKWVIQNNETGLEFLTRRAQRLGMELVINDGAVKLQKPTLTTDSVSLTWGQDLLDFKVRLSTANQVGTVTVRGWDPTTKAAVVGTSSTADFKPAIGITKDGAGLASTFGTKTLYSVYRPVTTQADAQLVAKAIHNDLNGRAIQMQGRCFGNKSIKVGARVEIKGVGTNYTGKYYVTSATHRFDIKGYWTSFESTGKSTNTIFDLTNQATERGASGAGGMAPIIGIVTDLKVPDDAKNRGIIKVKYPTLGDAIVSDWMPFVQPMAGPSQGFFFLPEVNDEVLVAFEQGDISRPYIIGAVWNGTDATPLAKSAYLDDTSGKIKQRILKTTSGHEVIFDDSTDARGITIKDKDTKNQIFIDSQNNKITIQSEAEMLLKAKTKMTIEAADLDIKITNKITESAGEIATEAKTGDIAAKSTVGNIKFTATTNFEAKGTAGAKMEGATLDLKGQGSAKLDGGAMTEIKGGLIKLN